MVLDEIVVVNSVVEEELIGAIGASDGVSTVGIVVVSASVVVGMAGVVVVSASAVDEGDAASAELLELLLVGTSPALTQPVLAVSAAGQVTCLKVTPGLSLPPNQSKRHSQPA